MSDKKYTYKGKEYTYADLQSKYGDKTDNAIEKFGFKESIPESKYSYNGKEYTYSDLENKYGDKTKQAIEKFGFEEIGVKKKESTSITPQQNVESKSESISLDYGKRNDGTKKGKGYFGELKMKDGSNNIATEISIGVNIDGKEIEIPTLVPSLSSSEKDWLLKGNDPNDRSKIGDIIANKAIKHARERINEGKSPFYEVDTKGQSKYKNAKEGTMAWNQEKIKQSNPDITNLFDQYKNAKSVSEEKKQDIVRSVDDEIEQKGFWNNTKLYAKKGFNATLDYLGQATGMSYLLGDGEVSDKLKLETKPLGEELKEVDKQHKEAISIAKKNNEPIPTFTEEQRLAKARELKIEKKVASQSESQVRSFLKKAESKVDSFKQSDKDKLHLFQQSELASLSEKDKVNLAEQNIQRLEINNLQNEVKHLISRAEKGEISQEEYIKQGTVLDTRYRTTIQEALVTYDKYVTNQKDIGDVKDNIDVMKRNYGWLKNFVDNAGATGADLTAGLINTGGWIDEVIGNDDPYLKNKTRQMAKVFTDIATDAREGIAKPIQVENINTLSDFGQWFSNTALASQVPIYAAVATGVGGIGALGVSATGTQWNEMQKDEDEGKADYNYWQKTFVPVGYGVSETISAYVDRLVMLNSARIIRSATSPERSLIAKGMWEGIKNTSKEVVKNASYEGLDETATEIMQNMMDIYALDKKDVGVFDNVLDAAAAGAVMGALMPIGATVVSKAVKPFSVDSKLASINKEILSLEKALDSSTLTQIERSTIESQLQKAKVKNQVLLESHVSDISTRITH